MFLEKKEEKILKEREEYLKLKEQKNKFLYDLMISGESDNQEFRKVASNYTKLKYSTLTLRALIKDLKALNRCPKNKNVFGMSIFEENTYNQVKVLYQKIRSNVEFLCENIADIDDFRKYHQIVLDAILYMNDVDFSLYRFVYSVTLNSNNINEVLKFKDASDVFWNSLKENWDYNTFIKKISIYREYRSLLWSANLYHYQFEKENKDNDLKENPTRVIEHNQEILNDNLYDKKTLLEAKKMMYEHARNAKSEEEEQNILNAIIATNQTLKRQ